MHMNIFDDDAFSAVSMTTALEDVDFKPDLIGSMNLFEDIPIATTDVSVERRGNTFSLIPTTPRGGPPVEGRVDGRNLRKYSTVRIAKGHTMYASEIEGIRPFGQETGLETMIGYVGRYSQRLVTDVEATWENMMLGAVQGVVLDADGSVIIDWFAEWGITKPAEINFALDTASTDVEQICRDITRRMVKASKGAMRAGSRVVGLAGDAFFDKLTKHKTIRETYLNTQQAQSLNRAFGVATQSALQSGSYATFEHGGILFINYRGTDDFDDAAAEAGNATGTEMLGIPRNKCKFFPMASTGIFQKAFAHGESWEYVNTVGRPLYQLMLRDRDRDFWVRPEVYSYPLYICTRPELLLTARAA